MSLADKFKKFSDEVYARLKYIDGDKGVLEKPHKKIKQWNPDGKVGKASRIAGLGTIDLTWFLFCLGKYATKDTINATNAVFLNNKIIDKLEQKKLKIRDKQSDSKFKKFFNELKRQHPRAAARLHLWMIYTLITLGVIGGGKLVQHTYKKNGKALFANNDDKEYEEQKVDYQTFVETLKPITPWLIVELITTEGVHLNKDGLHVPYKDSEGNWTIGFGSIVDKQGRRVTRKTPPITNEEAYELARHHIEEYETYPMLYWYCAYDNDLFFKTANEAVGMGSIFYNSHNKLIENKNDKNNKNRFETLRKYKAEYTEVPDSLILECFEKYPITNTRSFGASWLNHESMKDLSNILGGFCKEGGGLYWRRWLEAGLLSGELSPQMLLECPINGVGDFFFYMGGRNKNNRKWILWEKTANGLQVKKGSFDAFAEWLKNPQTRDARGQIGTVNRKKIKDFLPPDVVKQLENTPYNPHEKIKYVKSKNNKTIAFNDAVRKIQSLKKNPNNNFANYSNNNDYVSRG